MNGHNQLYNFLLRTRNIAPPADHYRYSLLNNLNCYPVIPYPLYFVPHSSTNQNGNRYGNYPSVANDQTENILENKNVPLKIKYENPSVKTDLGKVKNM